MDCIQTSSGGADPTITLTAPPPPLQLHTGAVLESEESQSPARKELLHDEWERLKPIIKRHYIDENQSFKWIQRLFTSEYQFTPTKRQFTRRTEKWGFRKNVKKEERDVILRSVEGATSLRTYPAAKVEQIRKRYGRKQYIHNLKDRGDEEHGAIVPDVAGAATTSENVFECTKALELASYDSQSLDISNTETQDLWPFDWESVDAPNSPGLTRMFSQLNLELGIDVPTLDLNENPWSSPITDEATIATEGSSDILPFPRDGESLLYSTNSEPYQSWTDGAVASKYLAYGLENEVGFFPESFGFRGMRRARLRDQKKCALVKRPSLYQLEIRLKQQEQNMRENIHDVYYTSWQIGVAYLESNRYSKAEHFLRGSLKLLKRNSHTDEHLIINVSLCLLDALCYQGRLRDAGELLNELRANIVDYRADHPRYSELTKAQIEICRQMRLFDGGFEPFVRQALQMELVKNGPWSSHSMYFVRILGISIARKRQDGNIRDPLIHKIVNTTVQHLRILEPDDSEFTLILDQLILIYESGGFYEEHKQLIHYTLERARLVFGENHIWTLRFSLSAALYLGSQGLLQECARLCQDLLAKYATLLDEVDATQISLIELYGHTLCKMRQFEEATLWLRKLYELRRDHRADLMFACDFLGQCYQSQGLYENAMDLYLLTIAELETRNERDPNIQVVKQWLFFCQSKIPEPHEASSQESSDSDAIELNVAHRTFAEEELAGYVLGNEDGVNECIPAQTNSISEKADDDGDADGEMWAYLNLQQDDLGANSA